VLKSNDKLSDFFAADPNFDDIFAEQSPKQKLSPLRPLPILKHDLINTIVEEEPNMDEIFGVSDSNKSSEQVNVDNV
jgi:hypothetical protein